MTVKYREHLFKDREHFVRFQHICFNDDFLVVSGEDNIVRVWYLNKDFQGDQPQRWKSSDKVTCVTLIDRQIAVATLSGVVYVLYCLTKNEILQIEEKCQIRFLDPRFINQILFKKNAINIECLIFTYAELYLCEWNITNVNIEIEEELPSCPGRYAAQNQETGTVQRIAREPDYDFKGIHTLDDNIMLVGISREQDCIKIVRHSNQNTWKIKKKGSTFHLLDLSQEGFILVQDMSQKRIMLINGCARMYWSVPGSFVEGHFLFISSTEIHCILQCSVSYTFRIHTWDYSTFVRTIHQTKSETKEESEKSEKSEENEDSEGNSEGNEESEDSEDSEKSEESEEGIISTVATHDGNIAIIQNGTSNRHPSVLILSRDQKDQRRSDLHLISKSQYYTPWCLQDGSDYIVNSAYLHDTFIPRGALLVRENDNQFILRWTYRKNQLHHVFLPVETQNKEKYTWIAMQQDIIVLCSVVTENYVLVQFWKGEECKTLTIDDVPSEIIKLISLESGKFCLVTNDKLISFDKTGRLSACNVSQPLSIHYNAKSRKLKVLGNTTIEIYDGQLKLLSHNHYSWNSFWARHTRAEFTE